MARSEILQFLRDPKAFSAVPARPELWRQALHTIAIPGIAAAGASGRPLRTLREAQIAAWEALTDQRLGLILGPPGTGKTFTLAWMALAYLEACRQAGVPCRVLITAFTRNATINMLEGIAAKARDVLGIEVPVRFLGDHSEDGNKPGLEFLSLKEFGKGIAQDHAVVGCTAWGIYKALEMGWHGGPRGSRVAEIFDLACIDEASQIQVPQALLGLAGLRRGGRVLVAGDNKQLSPIGGGYDWAVDDRSLGGSVYDFLVTAKIPEQRLSETFRLNEPLTSFPSRQFYGGEYFSAAAVKDQRLALNPDWERGLSPWQRIALSPEYPIAILLYDGPAAGTRNLNEVELVRQLVEALWSRMTPGKGAAVVRSEDFWSEQLAVVSPHRAQNVAIREALADSPAGQGCVVETVERIQGRERDAIIASYTVADPEFALAEAGFLFSPQRFNVSLTRARSKFILVMSRALLEVVPPDEAHFDAARLLREFVFECSEVGTVAVEARPGHALRVTLCVRRFDETSPLPADLLAPLPEVKSKVPPPVMTQPLQDMLTAIKQLSAQKLKATNGKYGDAADWEIAKRLARKVVDFLELRALLLNGHIVLDLRHKKDGSGSFWAAVPLEPPRIPLACDLETVRAELERVVLDLRAGGSGPFYNRVRDFFVWMDVAGRDVFRPILETLEQEGRLRLTIGPSGGELVQLEETPLNQTPPPPPTEVLSDEDFIALNTLEDVEARRINFGIYESWSNAVEIATRLGRSSHDVAESFRRLDAHGYLMRTDTEARRVRSRMAELARELRYVKQRFKTDDATERPYLVRSIKVIGRNREKPERNRDVAKVFADLQVAVAGVAHAPAVLLALEAVLRIRWGPDARISGFQERSWKALIPAWLGLADLHAAVITADTGAGKTEAAGLPLIVGAAVDVLSGIRGVRAVLVYPRIRLATNQAQRLTGYLRGLSNQQGMPRLTIGLQTGDVPESWDYARNDAKKAADNEGGKPPNWLPLSAGRWRFPFFACPDCEGKLTLFETGAPQDRLTCESENGCGWSFDGWVGTKRALIKAPPHIFLPVTESLHQWMQRPKYGPLFGDLADTPGSPCPPRAVLADEIHLYSLVPGAQVGYALRRLLARMKANGTRAPLAIGMSATLGDPARVWSDLIGGPQDRVLHIGPTPDERKPNVRGREYFYFVQPEVESRGHDIAGSSTTIQALMCLAHGMRRRTGKEGGYRGIVFLDSIDKLKRLHGDYWDAEENGRLARLRTIHKGEAPRCEAKSDRCGQDALACDRFREGECWFFAANDKAQWTARGLYEAGRSLAVCRNPIFSGTRGNADEIVRQSDIVFSTSSLEVGFDDPDMTLVYQHYAPLNLASFVQRKGRGGRGADDRPITGVTLSVYSPRDTWYFRAPERMLNASDFQVPLNTDNYFVRRGQVLSLLLDWAARWIARGGVEPDPHHSMEAVFQSADPVIREVFGARIYTDLDAQDLRDLWGQVICEARTDYGVHQLQGGPRDWGKALPQIPDNLFSPINLPLLTVSYPDEHLNTKSKEEDVTLAFAECAPGKGTRRWGHDVVHWNPYRGPRAPLFPSTGDAEFKPFKIDRNFARPEDVGRVLPRDARSLLKADPQIEYIRPIRLPIEDLGKLRGRTWSPFWEFDDAKGVVQRRVKDSTLPTIHHKSTSRLLGTVIAVADPTRAVRFPVDVLAGLTDGHLTSYKCHRRRGRQTGLRVTHAFWGADISLILETQKGPVAERKPKFLRQLFTHSTDPARPILFGYGMESEGICLELDSARLDRFILDDTANFARDSDDGIWLRAQHFRYLIAAGASGAGLNGFQARHLADLIVSAAALSDLRDQLVRCLKVWSWDQFRDILKAAYDRLLSQSPVLTGARIDALVDDLKVYGQEFKEFFVGAVRASGDEPKFKGWLRTAVLHGLVIRLKQLFVLHGRGDERKVLFHAMLPVQFDEGLHDRITVCEKGSFGDGTTRTFLGRANEAFAEWSLDGVVACPNARADRAMADAFAKTARHAEWRRLDSTDPKQLEHLGQELGLHPESDASALQLVVRLLYGQEEVFGERFTYFDLYKEIQVVRAGLRNPKGASPMLREPGTWELVGAVVHAAANGSADTPRWTRLLEIYGGLEEASMEESLAPKARLADQIYRICARLCPDGCQACLHLGSDLMDDDLAAMTVSRGVLERFWGFVQKEASGRPSPSGENAHLFPAGWAHVLEELRQVHGMVLEPGGDVEGPDGRVVGATVAAIRLPAGRLHLIDHGAPWAGAAVSALEETGERAVRLDPRRGADSLLDALER
jgi:hypothetical protein